MTSRLAALFALSVLVLVSLQLCPQTLAQSKRGPVACGDGSFATPVFAECGSHPYGVGTGDFDHDGDLDMAVCNVEGDDVTALAGNGSGGFTPTATLPAGDRPIDLAIADLDADNNLDILVARQDGIVSLFSGAGDGSFGGPSDFAVNSNPTDVTVADLDGDGHLDAATANLGSADISVLLGDGAGGFASAVSVSTVSGSPIGIKAADVSSDGRLDLLVGFIGESTIGVLLGNGDGTFGTIVRYPAGVSPGQLDVRDLNQDGDLDIATANIGGSSVSVLAGNGAGTFSPLTTVALVQSPTDIVSADFNADGIQDLAANVGDSSIIAVIPGLGGGAFGSPVTFPAGEATGRMVAADFNADSRPDLAAAVFQTSGVAVLLNSCGGCVIQCPADIRVTASATDGCGLTAVVNYALPSGTGHCDSVVCSPPSGSTFAEGTTVVTCAQQQAGQGANPCTFTVTVLSEGMLEALAVDDSSGDSWGIVTDSLAPTYRFWRYRVGSTGEVFCGTASRLAFAPRRSLVASDTDDPSVTMQATLNYGANAGTVVVTERSTGRRFVIRDRSLTASAGR